MICIIYGVSAFLRHVDCFSRSISMLLMGTSKINIVELFTLLSRLKIYLDWKQCATCIRVLKHNIEKSDWIEHSRSGHNQFTCNKGKVAEE